MILILHQQTSYEFFSRYRFQNIRYTLLFVLVLNLHSLASDNLNKHIFHLLANNTLKQQPIFFGINNKRKTRYICNNTIVLFMNIRHILLESIH